MNAIVLFLDKSIYTPTVSCPARIEFSTIVPGMVSIYVIHQKRTYWTHIQNVLFWIDDPQLEEE